MFPVVKRQKKNPLRLRNGSSSKYGEGGIRTLDTGINPYNGLANRRFRPLSHLSKINFLRLKYQTAYIL